MKLRSLLLYLVALILAAVALLLHGSSLGERVGGSKTETEKTSLLEDLRSRWDGQVVALTSAAQYPGVIWLKPRQAQDVATVYIGQRGRGEDREWFVIEEFLDEQGALQAMEDMAFVSNPPTSEHYFPSRVGRLVLISSERSVERTLGALLTRAD